MSGRLIAFIAVVAVTQLPPLVYTMQGKTLYITFTFLVTYLLSYWSLVYHGCHLFHKAFAESAFITIEFVTNLIIYTVCPKHRDQISCSKTYQQN